MLILEAAADLMAPGPKGYWTLVNYFNSLRDLGGALVLMRDDVARSIRDYAARRPGEVERDAGMQIELTSRVRSSDIPKYLKDLERAWSDPDHADIVLASNMIAVGMGVSRLGLMVVNGQPRTIAEYIPATSRVGRSQQAPGLVITLFNAAKSRDRSRYETFASWHRSLYRDVEATRVTPFAPRGRDRALHAPYVAMVRHLVHGMENPGAIEHHQSEAETLLETVIARIERIDPVEPLYGERMAAYKMWNQLQTLRICTPRETILAAVRGGRAADLAARLHRLRPGAAAHSRWHLAERRAERRPADPSGWADPAPRGHDARRFQLWHRLH